MPDLTIRPAQLDDTQAISQAFIQTVSVWQRLDDHGRVEEVSYDDLSIYERWLHGGHWMSVETGAIYLSHLIKAGVIVLAAYDGAALVGYVEAYPGDEPAPYGEHLHIGHLHAADAATRTALLRHTLKAATGHYRRVTVSFSAYDQETRAFFINHEFYELAQMRQYAISAQTGQGFYKAMPTTASPPQSAIKDWHMLSGRTQSAAHHWHHLWPRHWDAIAEITAQKTHRLQLNAAGQDAFVYIQQQLYVSRAADVYCWSPKPLTGQILIALRDWAYRADYRTLNMTLAPKDAQLLGSAAEEMPYQQAIFAFDLR